MKNYKENNSEYPAPTQFLLQKWLREIHKIDITIFRSFAMFNSYHYCITVDNNYKDELEQSISSDRTYEQAIEQALQESLKLINKIINNK